MYTVSVRDETNGWVRYTARSLGSARGIARRELSRKDLFTTRAVIHDAKGNFVDSLIREGMQGWK